MRRQHISVIAGISVVYGLVGFGVFMMTPADRYVDIRTWVDHLIPFQSIFAWPYLLYYVLLGIPLVLALPSAEWRLLWKRLAFASLISALVFIAVPTRPPRLDEVYVMSGFASWIVGWIYKIDPPANCFPSLHVLHSLVIAATYFQVPKLRRWGKVFFVMAIAVAASTVFIKQHYAADVAAAFFLAPVVCALANLSPQRTRREQELSTVKDGRPEF